MNGYEQFSDAIQEGHGCAKVARNVVEKSAPAAVWQMAQRARMDAGEHDGLVIAVALVERAAALCRAAGYWRAGSGGTHTNTIGNFFSVFKRGMKGAYQHCSKRHLHRYLAEFDFRYNERQAFGVSDAERAAKALQGITGKRLTYRRLDAIA